MLEASQSGASMPYPEKKAGEFEQQGNFLERKITGLDLKLLQIQTQLEVETDRTKQAQLVAELEKTTSEMEQLKRAQQDLYDKARDWKGIGKLTEETPKQKPS